MPIGVDSLTAAVRSCVCDFVGSLCKVPRGSLLLQDKDEHQAVGTVLWPAHAPPQKRRTAGICMFMRCEGLFSLPDPDHDPPSWQRRRGCAPHAPHGPRGPLNGLKPRLDSLPPSPARLGRRCSHLALRCWRLWSCAPRDRDRRCAWVRKRARADLSPTNACLQHYQQQRMNDAWGLPAPSAFAPAQRRGRDPPPRIPTAARHLTRPHRHSAPAPVTSAT